MEEPIYPKQIIKYNGGIRKRDNKWRVIIRVGDYKFYATVETKKEAKKLLKEKNIENNLPIKNIIHDCGNYLEVELTQGKRAKFDRDDLPIIEKYNWHLKTSNSNTTFHVATTIHQKMARLHNIIMNHIPGKLTVDHINIDGLDNRRENLRIVTRQIQNINHGLQKNNKSGTVGVYKMISNGLKSYAAQWIDDEGKQKTKCFSINKYGKKEAKKLAIAHRQRMEQTLDHYAEALTI